MNKLVFLCLLPLGLLTSASAQQQPARSDNSHLLMATLWYQRADEFRALCYQAYNLAQLRLDQELSAPHKAKRPAVVVDIDETVLDNSPFEARSIVNGTNYPVGWGEWVGESNADAVPGAVDFLTYAASKGVEVFYISNRKENEKGATIENLMKQRFPMADSAHLLLKTGVSNKESRRQQVLKDYTIVLLVGDNLNDFTDVFEGTPAEMRRQLTDSLRIEFGRRFIVLPNPMYGDWEPALGIKGQMPDSLKNSLRIKNLILK